MCFRRVSCALCSAVAWMSSALFACVNCEYTRRGILAYCAKTAVEQSLVAHAIASPSGKKFRVQLYRLLKSNMILAILYDRIH